MMQPGEHLSITEVEKSALQAYIEEELADSLIENTHIQSEWAENTDLYLSEPASKTKDFPWRGASNIVIPLIGITVDSVLARVVNTIFGVEPMWTATAALKQLGPIHKEIEAFMDWSAKTELKMYQPTKSWCLETVQDGWSWLKPVWEICSYQRYANGRWETYFTRMPKVHHVSPVDILPQCGVTDELEGDFFAQRVKWPDSVLRSKSFKGVFKVDIENIIGNKEDLTPIRKAQGITDAVTRERLNTGYECWINYSLGKKKKEPVSLVVTYHMPTKTIMRVMVNPNNRGIRQFVKGRFVEIRGDRRRGLGLARQLRSLQAEISTLHNQQVDNATLANTRFFLGRRNVIRADTKVWPGKVQLVNDPKTDLIPMQLGEVYNSMKALETAALSYAERRSGVSDYSLGRESSVVGDRATATGTLAILQEGNRRFDLNVRDLRDSLQQVGYMLLELNHQYRPKGLAYLVQGEEAGEVTERFLDLPSEFASMGMGLELTASSGTINKQVEQASLLQLMGILTQHLQMGQTASMMMADPNVPPAAKEYTSKQMEGITTIMRRIAQTFEQRNAEDIIPAIQAYEGQTALAGQPIPGGAPGMPQLPQGIPNGAPMAPAQGTA